MSEGATILTRPDQTRPDQTRLDHYCLLASNPHHEVYLVLSNWECAYR